MCESCVRKKITSMESANTLNESPIIAEGARGRRVARFSNMSITEKPMNEVDWERR